ncbi:MAG TPA: efflux transporter outer membrane subunit [Geobacteraceae bacterium]
MSTLAGVLVKSLVNRSSLSQGVRDGIVAALAAALLAGCAVGPDFRTPAAPKTAAYTATPLPAETAAAPGAGGEAQRFVSDGEIPGEWWHLFHSEPLDRVIRQALAESPTLATAAARLRQAEENLRSRSGAVYYPSVDGKASVNRSQISGAAFGQPGSSFAFTLYDASVNVSYALDLAGGGRRELEGLGAQVEYQRFQLEGAHLTLAANIVTTAVKEASLRLRIAATRELLALQERQLGLVDEQFRLGAVPLADLLAQQAQLAQLRATLPPLEKELEQTRHQLAVLAGRFPGDGGLPTFSLDELQLPREVPVSVPSALVRQRPDIRAAEELLRAASADVGVATAALYPQLTLTGNLGSQATRPETLFTAGTAVWGLGAGLLQPLFHGGEFTAKRRAAIAAYDAAAAQYRETVLQAFLNVADVLRALNGDAATLKALAESEAAARESFEAAQEQFRLGAVGYLTLLRAERQYQEARLAVAPARAARFADTAALFQALGGGWWNRTPEGEAAAAKKNPD